MLKERARDRMFKRAVGGFVLASAVTLLIVLRMYQQSLGHFKETFKLQAISPGASGLEIDAPITMAGLKIGRVVAIKVTPENTVKLDLEIQGAYRDKVREDSVASQTRPIIGSAFIDVSMGSPKFAEIPAGSYIALRRLPDINDIIAGFAPQIEKVDRVLTQVESTTRHLNELTQRVTADQGPIDRSLAQVERTAGQAAEAAGTLNRMLATTHDTLKRALPETERLIKDAQRSTQQVNAILADVKQGTARIDSLTQRTDAILATTEGIAADVKQATPQVAPLMSSGQDALNEADDVLRAAKNSFLLREGSLPPPPSPLPAGPR